MSRLLSAAGLAVLVVISGCRTREKEKDLERIELEAVRDEVARVMDSLEKAQAQALAEPEARTPSAPGGKATPAASRAERQAPQPSRPDSTPMIELAPTVSLPDTATATATAPIEIRPPKPELSATTDGYVINLGSYADNEFALMMADTYQKRGYPALVRSVEVKGRIYYRLSVGPYQTTDQAKETGERLKQEYGAEYWIGRSQ